MMIGDTSPVPAGSDVPVSPQETPPPAPAKEIGGRNAPDPTRYGDWEKKGVAIDF